MPSTPRGLTYCAPHQHKMDFGCAIVFETVNWSRHNLCDGIKRERKEPLCWSNWVRWNFHQKTKGEYRGSSILLNIDFCMPLWEPFQLLGGVLISSINNQTKLGPSQVRIFHHIHSWIAAMIIRIHWKNDNITKVSSGSFNRHTSCPSPFASANLTPLLFPSHV